MIAVPDVTQEIPVFPGDLLLLFSDGLYEANDQKDLLNMFYGELLQKPTSVENKTFNDFGFGPLVFFFT